MGWMHGYETSPVKHVPEYDVMVLRCYVTVHTVVVFRMQSYNIFCENHRQ